MLSFRSWKPVWKYAPRPYRPKVLLVVYWGRMDDFEEAKPSYLFLRLRLFLIRSFLLKISLPDWLDEQIYRRRTPWRYKNEKSP
jgi:hypothetical protein